MRPIKVNKDELIAKVKVNRDLHRKIFEEAVDGYRKQAVSMLESHIERIKAGKVARVTVTLPQPDDHTADYDRVLAMLEMEIDDEITLDENDFAAYVMDDWAWKRQFLATNSAYSETAAFMVEQ